MHDVVRELGEGEGVAERLLKRLLPVGDALQLPEPERRSDARFLASGGQQFTIAPLGDVGERTLIDHFSTFDTICTKSFSLLGVLI